MKPFVLPVASVLACSALMFWSDRPGHIWYYEWLGFVGLLGTATGIFSLLFIEVRRK